MKKKSNPINPSNPYEIKPIKSIWNQNQIKRIYLANANQTHHQSQPHPAPLTSHIKPIKPTVDQPIHHHWAQATSAFLSCVSQFPIAIHFSFKEYCHGWERSEIGEEGEMGLWKEEYTRPEGTQSSPALDWVFFLVDFSSELFTDVGLNCLPRGFL